MTPRGALQAEGSCGDRHLPKPCAPHPCPVKTLQKQWVETLGASYGMRTFVLSDRDIYPAKGQGGGGGKELGDLETPKKLSSYQGERSASPEMPPPLPHPTPPHSSPFPVLEPEH